MVTRTVEIFLAWTPLLISRNLKQKLPRPPWRLRSRRSRLEPQHRLLQLPLVTARRTTHARRPRSPSPLTQKPASQRRVVPDPPYMHPRMETSTIYHLLARAQTRLPRSKTKRSVPMPALGQSTRFLPIHMERPQARQLVHLPQAVLKPYRLSRQSGLRR